MNDGAEMRAWYDISRMGNDLHSNNSKGHLEGLDEVIIVFLNIKQKKKELPTCNRTN